MFKQILHIRWHTIPAVIVVTLVLTACATTARTVNEKLDPLTGVTVTYSKSPLMVYRESPSHAAYSRNYVDLGPIEVNKSGTYKYYLWLGIWGTLQTRRLSDLRDEFESIILMADGEPLSLDLAGWTPATIETSEPVYPRAFATSLDAYYRVTADQIRFIVEAGDLQLRTTGPSPLEFGLWGEQRSARRDLSVFLDHVFGN
jgi:hypothetical protein